VDGVVIAGTNGEGVSLSVTERKHLLEAAIEHANGLRVMASTGACALSDALALTRHAARCGASATLVLPPFYFSGASPEGIAAYYWAVADAADLPILLYSIPQFTGVPMCERLLSLLRGVPSVVGVKESSGDLEAGRRLLANHPELCLFVGSDLLLSELMRHGAAGVISGIANALPELIVAVAEAVAGGTGVAETQRRLNEAIRIITAYPIVGAAKAILEARGVARMSVRPPLVMPDPTQVGEMLARLKDGGFLR
jgi:dihydrodipicolinate synthase/N-acetylneuraminate lyase